MAAAAPNHEPLDAMPAWGHKPGEATAPQRGSELVTALEQWGRGEAQAETVWKRYGQLVVAANALPHGPGMDERLEQLGSHLRVLLDDAASEAAADGAIDGVYGELQSVLGALPAPGSRSDARGLAELVRAVVREELERARIGSPDAAALQTQLEAAEKRYQSLVAQHARTVAELRAAPAAPVAALAAVGVVEPPPKGDSAEHEAATLAAWLAEPGAELPDDTFRRVVRPRAAALQLALQRGVADAWAEIDAFRQGVLAADPDPNTRRPLPTASAVRSLEERLEELAAGTRAFTSLVENVLKPRFKAIWEDSLQLVVAEQELVAAGEALASGAPQTLEECRLVVRTLERMRSLAARERLALLLAGRDAVPGAAAVRPAVLAELETAAVDPSARARALSELDVRLDKRRARAPANPMSIGRFHREAAAVATVTGPDAPALKSALTDHVRQAQRRNPRNWRAERLLAIESVDAARRAADARLLSTVYSPSGSGDGG